MIFHTHYSYNVAIFAERQPDRGSIFRTTLYKSNHHFQERKSFILLMVFILNFGLISEKPNVFIL